MAGGGEREGKTRGEKRREEKIGEERRREAKMEDERRREEKRVRGKIEHDKGTKNYEIKKGMSTK